MTGTNGRKNGRKRRSKPNGANGNGDGKKNGRSQVTVRDALVNLQVQRHRAAVARHLASSVVSDFLGDETGGARFAIGSWAGGTEPARAEAIVAVQQMLEAEATRAREMGEAMLNLLLEHVPAELLQVIKAPPPELAAAFDQPAPWSATDEATSRGACLPDAPRHAQIGTGGKR
jgi:hypothetical protein